MCAHVHLYVCHTCPTLEVFSAPQTFLMCFFDSQEALFRVYSAPDVRRMAKPFRREGLGSQPELEDTEGPHTLSLAKGWWSWWYQVSLGDKPGDQRGLETPPETWGGCKCDSERSAEQRPHQLLDTEGGVCLLLHLARRDLPTGHQALCHHLRTLRGGGNTCPRSPLPSLWYKNGSFAHDFDSEGQGAVQQHSPVQDHRVPCQEMLDPKRCLTCCEDSLSLYFRKENVMTEHPQFPEALGVLETALALAKTSTTGNQEQQTDGIC